ncbi:restriction endonuclease subunit S [Vibrio fluvialis]|nr:restriction endonuclease subunit S [Vibrio fluvialis]
MRKSHLPEGWCISRISDISMKGEQRKPSDEETFIYVDIGSINRDLKCIESPQHLIGKDAPSRARKVIRSGDILVSLTRPNLNAVALVPCYLDNQIASTGFEVITTLMVDSRYIFALTRSKDFIDSISGVVQGALYPAAKSSDVQAYTFSLPPLAEQKVIADKLDTLLAQVEATKVRLERIPQILKTFRQSVLVAAVSGKLTEEWRNNNNGTPVHETLAKIETVKQQFIGKDKKAQAHLKNEEYVIPNTWQWVSLDSLTKKITDGTHHTPTYTESGVHFISVKDIRDGVIDFSDTKFISEKEHQELSKRCPVEVGDLLITKSGTIGRTAIVKKNIALSLFVSVALIKPVSNDVNIKFIDISLQKWVNEIDVSSRIVGSAIKNLHLRDMKVLAIPFAPKEEQAEIVRRVEELLAVANSIEQKANAVLERLNTLPQSILTKAFRGDLTADWRDNNPELISGDNSAEALLEKIKTERVAFERQSKLKSHAVQKKTGSRMRKQIIKVTEALKQAGEPLNGQQLLAAAGYPNDSNTDQLEQFFLDLRNALAIEKSILKLERGSDSQDWFALAKTAANE